MESMAYFLNDYVFAAKYPFSSKAKEIMREQNVQVNELIMEQGFERLSNALKGEIKRKVFLHEEDAINEIIGYVVARMILSSAHNRFLTNKYAVAESKKTFSYLNEEDESSLLLLAKDMGINSFRNDGERITVDVTDFLTYSPKDVHYKLILRELENGEITITKHEQARLIAEAVRKYLEHLPQIQALPPIVKNISEKLLAMLPKIEPQKIIFKEGENPPCIEAILEMLKKHENIGHSGRWLLAVYLINCRMANKEIQNIFSNAPDYNEKITIYQIEHAEKRGYKMPNCQSVASYGYCTANCGTINPMNWLKKAMRK